MEKYKKLTMLDILIFTLIPNFYPISLQNSNYKHVFYKQSGKSCGSQGVFSGVFGQEGLQVPNLTFRDWFYH